MRTNVRAPGVSAHAGAGPIEGGHVEPGEQSDALAQGGLEVELAGHGTSRELGHRVTTTALVREQLDHLVLDERRVDVQHHEPLGPASQAVGLDRDVDRVDGGDLDEPRAQLVDRRARHRQLVAEDRVAGQTEDAIDVPPAARDRIGDRARTRSV